MCQPNKRTSSRTRTMSPLEAATETEERVTIDNIGRIHARMIRYEHTTRVPVYRTRGGPSWLRLRTGFPPLVVDVSPQMPRLLRTDRRTDTTRGRPAFADCRRGGVGGLLLSPVDSLLEVVGSSSLGSLLSPPGRACSDTSTTRLPVPCPGGA